MKSTHPGPTITVDQLPVPLRAVALIDAKTAAAVGQMSISKWYDEVRLGKAPQPAIREPRFTRWRQADVLRYWERRGQEAANDPHAGEAVVTKAKKASEAARACRESAIHRLGADRRAVG